MWRWQAGMAEDNMFRLGRGVVLFPLHVHFGVVEHDHRNRRCHEGRARFSRLTVDGQKRRRIGGKTPFSMWWKYSSSKKHINIFTKIIKDHLGSTEKRPYNNSHQTLASINQHEGSMVDLAITALLILVGPGFWFLGVFFNAATVT